MSNPYAQFFLSSPRTVAQLELLEISHPSFSKIYYIVRNKFDGVTVKLETGTFQAFEYYPLRITRSGATDDLDNALQIDLGDLGELVAVELDAVRAAGTFGTRPVVKFRVYRSDSLSVGPLYGPLTYEVVSFAMLRDGVSFTAQAPTLNLVKTGARYLPERFPMLRGML
jgi:hypothetical protein